MKESTLTLAANVAADYRQGYAIRHLAAKYNKSVPRIYQLLDVGKCPRLQNYDDSWELKQLHQYLDDQYNTGHRYEIGA